MFIGGEDETDMELTSKPLESPTFSRENIQLRAIPKDIALKCPKCKEIIFKRDHSKNLKVCPTCHYHFRLTAYERINLLVDPDTFVEMDADLVAADPLRFVSQRQVYAEKLSQEREKVGINDAVVTGYASIEGRQ